MRSSNKKNVKVTDKTVVESPLVLQQKAESRYLADENKLIPGTKSKRQVFRICRNCQKQFYAKRRDAKYCSASCKQKAHLRQEDSWNYYDDPAEFFLTRIIELKLNRFFDMDGEPIDEDTLEGWRLQSELVTNVIFPLLEDKNFFKRFYEEEIDGFYQNIETRLHRFETYSTFLFIPSEKKSYWRKFLDAFK